MKKTILMIAAWLLPFFCWAQLAQEGFEGSWPPVGWGIYDNGIGLEKSWVQTAAGSEAQPAYEGNHAAYIDRENTTAGIPEDWLVTKRFFVPSNGELRFFSRLTIALDQGTIYQVRISESADQAALGNYTLLQEWTEPQLNLIQREYTEKVVPLPTALAGQEVYIAFVMKGVFGDRWIIDNVSVTEKCLAPENAIAQNPTLTSAELSWDNPSGATQWEIEIVAADGIPTGSGQVYNGTLPYVPTLAENTAYKYYVRAICPLGGKSPWTNPVFFKTARRGDSCAAPIVVNSLPYGNTDTTANAANNFTGGPGSTCGTPDWVDFINGNDVVYTYTPAVDETILIRAAGLSNNAAGVYVYASCADIGTNCIAADYNDGTLDDLVISQLNVTAGTTYHILVSSMETTTTYELTIQKESCASPTGLMYANQTINSVELSWTENGSATAWQYVLQPLGTGIPTGNGTDITTAFFNPQGMSAGTEFEFYVRSACGDGTYSIWAGPLRFNTLCTPVSTPLFEGFNTDSANQHCWIVTDVNNDGRKWNLDNSASPQEGDQSASFSTDFSTDNDDMLISPTLNVTANQRLRFRYRVESWAPTHFRVALSTTGISPASFTTELVPLTTYNNADYKELIVDLTAYEGQSINVAWHVPAGNAEGQLIFIDNINFEAWPACAEPLNLSAGNLTASTAQVSWTAGHTETNWDLFVKPITQGSNPPAASEPVIAAGTNPFTVNDLQPNTAYYVFVRANCGTANGTSQWVGPFAFTTACVALPIPFFEGFNTDSAKENCWTITNANGDWSTWNTNAAFPTPYEGDQMASIFAGSNGINDWLISPAITLTGNERLKFHYRTGDGGGKFRVMLSTTGKETADFTTTLLPSAVYSNNDFVKEIISLEGYTGPVYIAWHANPPSGGFSNIDIDNVIIEPIPACPEPLTVSIGAITQTSAEVSWTPDGTETQWEIAIQETGQGMPAGAGIPVTANPYTITTLTNGQPLLAGGTYQVYVRAICGAGSQSIWTDALTFTTAISNDECADAIVLPVNADSNCTQYRWGTTATSTVSAEEACDPWSSYKDVWFRFTATAETHTVSLDNITENGMLEYAMYEGSCSSLANLICGAASSQDAPKITVLSNLTVGQEYTIRVFGYDWTPDTSFTLCVRTPVTPIAVSTTQYTIDELVRDVLVGSECSQVSNITYSTGSTFGGPSGIGSFTKNGADFPFESGIILSTGDAATAPGPKQGQNSGSVPGWPGDNDLEQIIEEGTGLPMNSTNATILEFDFVPLRDMISFDFLFASEEYGIFQCNYSDSFAFIMTDANGNTQNLAVVPGTATPISVITIRDAAHNVDCDSQNPSFFGGFYGTDDNGNHGDSSPINYNGRTVVMQAQGAVTIGEPYHIKMVIADRGDEALDSAVFLGAETFNLGKMNLGADMLVANGTAVCEGEERTLDSQLDPEAYLITWEKDGVVIPGENNAALTVTEAGTYEIIAERIGFNCSVTDSIVIEYYPAVTAPLAQPLDLTECTDSTTFAFDIASNTAVILNGNDASDYTISYHTSNEDAESGSNALGNTYTNTSSPQIIYVRITDNTTLCSTVTSFTIAVTPKPEFTLPQDFTVCENANETLAVTAVNFNLADATYAWTLDGVALTAATPEIAITTGGTYEVTVTNGGCTDTATVTVTVNQAPVVDAPQNEIACSQFTLLPLTNGTYYTAQNGTGTALQAGDIIAETTTLYAYAANGDCSAENSFTVTIIPAPQFSLGGPYTVCKAENAVITVMPANFAVADAHFAWSFGGTAVGTDSPTHTAAEFGTYTLTVTVGDCTHTETVQVTPDTDAFELVLTDSCQANVYTVAVSDKDGSFDIDTATYAWTGPGNFTSEDSEIYPAETGDYTVTVTTIDGCVSEKTFPVTSTTCDIQRGISPNGDGLNDNFDLSTLDVRKLSIFNRYGQEVYSKGSYTNEWKGQDSKGNELPTGTYFYMIERQNGESKTGWIYINRQD